MVFRQGEEMAALIICDVISIKRPLSDEIRAEISKITGIPVSHISLTATHTHTGPAFRPLDSAQIEKLSKGEPYQQLLAEYVPFFKNRCVQACVNAKKVLKPATFQFGRTITANISFNRRYYMKDGSVKCNPGLKNPNVVRPVGPTDPELSTLLFSDADKKPCASLTVFALHLDTTGGNLFSADYPAYMAKILGQKFGDDFISIFGTGTCGDINHVDVNVSSLKELKKAPDIGLELGNMTLGIMQSGLQPVAPTLKVASRKIQWPYHKFSAERIAEAEKAVAESKDKKVSAKLSDLMVVASLQSDPKGMPLEVQAYRLGPDTAIVTLPSEVFVDLGLAIKKASPFLNTMVIELADCILYVPTIKAFQEGGYETHASLIEPGGGEKLVEMAIDCLNELKK
ncbi:MAG: hypothetical protein Q4G59_12160, partial [Planctomycetia bacterium]|nr:hypothetical protein [Planctomycetia bacterium]